MAPNQNMFFGKRLRRTGSRSRAPARRTGLPPLRCGEDYRRGTWSHRELECPEATVNHFGWDSKVRARSRYGVIGTTPNLNSGLPRGVFAR